MKTTIAPGQIAGQRGKAAAAPSATKTPPVIGIKAAGSGHHWSYQLPAGGLVGGVVTLRLTNASTDDSLDSQLARVDRHHSAQEVKAAVTGDGGPIPARLHAAGGVTSVAPGQASQATLSLPGSTSTSAPKTPAARSTPTTACSASWTVP